jgi:hypothetical protein
MAGADAPLKVSAPLATTGEQKRLFLKANVATGDELLGEACRSGRAASAPSFDRHHHLERASETNTVGVGVHSNALAC